jgi:DNA-directed RNA polymerase subunit alpha
VRKVNFNVEPVRVGREETRERLVLEVWTDGTLSPTDALSRSAAVVTEQLAPFASYTPLAAVAEKEKTAHVSIPDEQYNMPVEQLNLSVRVLNSLRRGGITTVGELLSKGERELMSLRNFGSKSKQEVEDKLKEMGLSFNQN